MSNLKSLPIECQLQIFTHVDFGDVLSLRRVSRFHLDLVDSNATRLPQFCHQHIIIRRRAKKQGLKVTRDGRKNSVLINSNVWCHLNCDNLVLSQDFGVEDVEQLLSVLRSSPRHRLHPTRLVVNGWGNVNALILLPDIAWHFSDTINKLWFSNCSLPTEDFPYLTKTASALPHLSSVLLALTMKNRWPWTRPSYYALSPFALNSLCDICDTHSIKNLHLDLLELCLTAESVMTLIRWWHKSPSPFFLQFKLTKLERRRFVDELLPFDGQLGGSVDYTLAEYGFINVYAENSVDLVLHVLLTGSGFIAITVPSDRQEE